jgi:hypothetical protein
MKTLDRNRPTTFGIKTSSEIVEIVDWAGEIRRAVGGGSDSWMAVKFIGLLDEHKRKYPAFQPDRVAEIFIRAPVKTRAFYCYQPISRLTKMIHKSNSFRSLCDSQS